ncbi:hypothetical protein M4L90_07435 [Staphylococcus equorum]|uniref:Uncharacterized protein n=1 Tax=Staphylococcus equorum TaxID=246432 RepID=A0A9X4R0K5_9STAP|nr:hypothetical protein [Staphylococcus equorum]MDG0819733.1 hypothetical protein [Staphylococcus equorum]MDG0840374.1 hypothetical protein [Staphylococcus equorum]MDG0846057.1 hypothetical protein [Staphylococcus equorum]PTE25995.1 hypothetical protein BUY91_12405 [Staphylococcus equorum]PTE81828.1 hypothetical protein BUY90_13010 [Staphylococcus equorum]
MVFLYIVTSGVVLYLALRYAIRDAIIECEASKDKLIYLQKSEDIFEDIRLIYSNFSKKEDKAFIKEAKKIYEESFDILNSDMNSEEKYNALRCKKTANAIDK